MSNEKEEQQKVVPFVDEDRPLPMDEWDSESTMVIDLDEDEEWLVASPTADAWSTDATESTPLFESTEKTDEESNNN